MARGAAPGAARLPRPRRLSCAISRARRACSPSCCDGGDEAARAALIDGLALFGIGYSWGGYESLALPVDPQRYRTATDWHAEGPVVRLQIGLEDPDDLIADLDAGLARFREARG